MIKERAGPSQGSCDPFLIDAADEMHSALVPLVGIELRRQPKPVQTICEIGCGSGRFLRGCLSDLPRLSRFVGLHSRQQQVERNRLLYRPLPLQFESVTLVEWLALRASPGTVYLTDAGQLLAEAASSMTAIWAGFKHSYKPTLLAISIPKTAAHLHGAVRRRAKCLHRDITATFSAQPLSLVLAEF